MNRKVVTMDKKGELTRRGGSRRKQEKVQKFVITKEKVLEAGRKGSGSGNFRLPVLPPPIYLYQEVKSKCTDLHFTARQVYFLHN